MFPQQAFLQLEIFAIHHKKFIWNANLKKVCVSWINIRKKLLRMKPQAEVLAFGAYMFESLQSFYNSLIKVHSMFSMSNLQLICQNCRTFATSICYYDVYIGQLYRYLESRIHKHCLRSLADLLCQTYGTL